MIFTKNDIKFEIPKQNSSSYKLIKQLVYEASIWNEIINYNLSDNSHNTKPLYLFEKMIEEDDQNPINDIKSIMYRDFYDTIQIPKFRKQNKMVSKNNQFDTIMTDDYLEYQLSKYNRPESENLNLLMRIHYGNSNGKSESSKQFFKLLGALNSNADGLENVVTFHPLLNCKIKIKDDNKLTIKFYNDINQCFLQLTINDKYTIFLTNDTINKYIFNTPIEKLPTNDAINILSMIYSTLPTLSEKI